MCSPSLRRRSSSSTQQKAQELAEKLKKNRFTLQDYYDQLVQVKGMGSVEELLGMMPGINAKALEGATINEKALTRTEAIILSMTPQERENPSILNSSRKKRIAAGCGLQVVDVNRLLKEFGMMQQMTKQMSKLTGKRRKGKFGKMPGVSQGCPLSKLVPAPLRFHRYRNSFGGERTW